MRLAEAEALFRVKHGRYTRTTLHEIYRQAARLCHPDRGGNRESWDMLQSAYSLLLHESERPRRCPSCLGNKRVTGVRRGHFYAEKCETCAGTGQVVNQDI